MTASSQVTGSLVILAVLFALTLVPMESTMRALAAALVITIGGGTMAFLRSRNAPPNQPASRRR